ncbi:GlyS Glycyl-tRNA synthetase, beta subunit [Burkholderiaceae bacterium]
MAHTLSPQAPLLVELLVEELPPKALSKLGQAFAHGIFSQLQSQGLLAEAAQIKSFASPRRLAVHIDKVLAQAPARQVQHKLMPVSVGLDAQGQATPALLKKLGALGFDAAVVAQLQRTGEGKAEVLMLDQTVDGMGLVSGLQLALEHALAKLPIPKVMSYQLEQGCELPGWSSVSFVRPAHGLVALHGDQVLPVHALGLQAGSTTQGHRFEATCNPVRIAHADAYADTLLKDGAVVADFEQRRADIVRQLNAAAANIGAGVRPIEDAALLDEVTALVERPNVLICAFEKQFLDVPQECLILTMKANQKYFPLLDTTGKLTHQFLVVSNITPDDASAVIGGNERVVRPRLADAKFFYDQDRKKTLDSRVAGLDKVVYHNKLGTQGERMQRVCAIAHAIGLQMGGQALADKAQLAARLAKTDLLTDMVGEFPELQGIMGQYYARHDGHGDDIAQAIADHYRPRFAGDELPANDVGIAVALADKLETLVGMFGIGNLPTGDKDPFALRRHALGVIRMLIEKDLALDLPLLIALCLPVFGDKVSDASQALMDFIDERLSGNLREQGYSAQEVDAVLALHPPRLGDVPKRLHAVRAFVALPESPALAAANKRIANILKKAGEVDAHVNTALLSEDAEKQLHAAMQQLLPPSEAQFKSGDYTASLQTLAALRAPVDVFFEGVMVNADEMDLRLNRQGLLKMLHVAMNRVADLSRLAV